MNRTITAVPGLTAAHATETDHRTGCTVLRFDDGARGGLWVPGSAPGGREWAALDPDHVAGEVHAVVLSGGSAFGLRTADGVMVQLAEEGIGFDTGFGRVPIVPAAILFDLHTATARPSAALGLQAARQASSDALPEGRVGAATGALIGVATGSPVPGGLGSTAAEVGGWTVGAVAAVNAAGVVIDGTNAAPDLSRGLPQQEGAWRGQTTLVAVATDAPLDRSRCRVLAKMAAAGLPRALRPAFSPFDGDVVFAISTGSGSSVDNATLLALGDAAARLVEQAIRRGASLGALDSERPPP